MSAMSRLFAGLIVGAIAFGHPLAATAQLADARRLYNQTRYEEAIKAAAVAQSDPGRTTRRRSSSRARTSSGTGSRTTLRI